MPTVNNSRISMTVWRHLILLLLISAVGYAQQNSTLTTEQRSNIDGIAQKVLETTGVPSASLAVVKDGKIAYVQAYGDARLDPKLARPYFVGRLALNRL